jgi:hypothetical protein
MARNTEASKQIIISAATRRKNTPRKTLLVYVKKKKNPTQIYAKNQSKVLKFNNNLIKQHKHDTSPSLRCSRKNRMTGKNFMKLIISI